jgi:glycosyltransferase involved in cell wall biosynthesis
LPFTFVVLLATYNGAHFIDEQIASIARQDVSRINLLASDDGSTDSTVEILRRWKTLWTKGDFHIFEGPRRGFADNFRSLALREAGSADYAAFSDQDDIWDADKLSRSAALIEQDKGPAITFGRTRVVDAAGRPRGLSPLFRRPPSFRNALLQSIGGGNTMVLNRAAFVLLRESCHRTIFVAHDWWAYLICSGAGGSVRYDPVPHLSYRQHGENAVGANTGLGAQFGRLRHLAGGGYAGWITRNLDALARCDYLLTPDARAAADELRVIKSARGLAAAMGFRHSGLYRQSRIQDAILTVAAMLGKL